MAFQSMQTRQEIFDSVTQIKQVSQQPSDFLTDILIQQQQYSSIEWLYRFNILAEVPLPPDSISYPDAAAKIGVSESTLRAVARMAMTANFLCETKDGKLAHNSLSASFVEDEGLAAWLSYLIKGSVPCMRAFPDATRKWSDSRKRNEAAYNVAMSTELSFFEHLKANPNLSAEFGKYMKSQSTVATGTSADHLLKGYDWEALGDAKIVDVSDLLPVDRTILTQN
jgi:6-hydroxytryprostatin B O-methyltransferase